MLFGKLENLSPRFLWVGCISIFSKFGHLAAEKNFVTHKFFWPGYGIYTGLRPNFFKIFLLSPVDESHQAIHFGVNFFFGLAVFPLASIKIHLK